MARRIGVTLLASSYPSPSAPTRGAFVEDIALGLLKDRPVTVVAPWIYPQDPSVEARRGIAVRRFGFGSKGVLLKEYGGTPIPLMLRYMASGLWRTVLAGRGAGSSAIFAHWVLPAGVIGAVASLLTGRPLVLYAHGSDICVYAEKSPFYRRLTRFVLGRSRHIFAVSRDIERRLSEGFGVPGQKISVVSCGVDSEHFCPLPEPLAVGPGGPKFLFVGDMVPAKGVAELIDAALALHRAGHCFSLDMVGDGPLVEALRKRADEAGATEHIRWHGTVPRARVAALINGAHCLILPSYNEGTPVCVMEALSSGVPVIASDVGGIPDQIEPERTGLLIAPKDVDALSTAMGRVITEDGLLARLTAGARQTGDRFSMAKRQAEVSTIMGKLLDGA